MLDKNKNRLTSSENVSRNHVANLEREEQNARDIELINQRTDELNAETMDMLEYQVPT